MKNIKVVLFDHDDTLVNTIGPKSEEHKFVAKTYYDIELSDTVIRENWGKPLDELFQVLYKTNDAEEATRLNKAHHSEYPKSLIENSPQVLQKLKEAGYKTGIITATSRFSILYDLDDLGFSKNSIDHLQTQEDTKYHKPDPRVFGPIKVWLQDQGLKPDQVLYVGDSLRDFHAARDAGLQFVGVETGITDAATFKQAGVKSVPHVGHLISDILV